MHGENVEMNGICDEKRWLIAPLVLCAQVFRWVDTLTHMHQHLSVVLMSTQYHWRIDVQKIFALFVVYSFACRGSHFAQSTAKQNK